MKKIKDTGNWILICNATLIISTFIHECVHGLSCWLAGYAVSTGFNRVGNAYKFPSDTDFRLGFTGGETLKDFGPAVTLVMAVVFTVILIRRQYQDSFLDKSILALGLSNSLIRFVPCVAVFIRIVITGSGMEDEIGQGEALAGLLGWPFMKYALAAISLAITASCLYLLYKQFGKYKKQGKSMPNPSWIWLAYVTSFIILNVLDRYIRINWVPKI